MSRKAPRSVFFTGLATDQGQAMLHWPPNPLSSTLEEGDTEWALSSTFALYLGQASTQALA